MANYSDLKLDLLDELCDKLDESGIEGNVIERDSRGRPYVNIWYGSFNDYRWQLSEMFTVLVTDYSFSPNPFGCYEIKPPEKYQDYFKDTFMACRSRTAGFYVMRSDQIIHVIKHLFDIETSIRREELKKENNMNEFTLETYLFDKLRENNIRYKFKNGIYNPEEIIVTTKTGYNICVVRSIPDSESSRWAYEARWIMVPSYVLASLKLDRVKEYETSDKLIADILSVERELEPIEMKSGVRTPATPHDAFLYAKADVLATEALYKYREYSIVDVIFNDPATIIIWADGTKTVVKAENEKFDPEKGLAMAISKKVLGNKHDYYEVFKKYVGRYEKKQAKKVKKEN